MHELVRVGVVIAVSVGVIYAGLAAACNVIASGARELRATRQALHTDISANLRMSAQADAANGPDAPSRKELIAIAAVWAILGVIAVRGRVAVAATVEVYSRASG